MTRPLHRRTVARRRLRFGVARRCARFRFRIKSLLAFTATSAILFAILKWLLPPVWPVLPIAALLPPLVGVFVLLSVTEGAVWKGVLRGLTAAILFTLIFPEDFLVLMHRRGSELPSGFLGWAIQLCYLSLAFRFACFPLIGGCLEAIRKRFISPGINSLFAAFAYYFVLVLIYIGILSRAFILPKLGY